MSVSDLRLVARMRRAGIVNPVWTLRAARKAHLPLPLACAFLDQETGGGKNVWGHDPTIFVGGGKYGPKVTKQSYLAYRKQRGPGGHGGMQGVGPLQLTYYTFQDEADGLGGCWKPFCNLQVGFSYAARNIRRYGLRAGVRAYNGSGPAAERYADSVLAGEKKWASRLGVKSCQG